MRNEVISWINLQAQNCTNNFHLLTTNVACVTLWVNNGQMELLAAFVIGKFSSQMLPAHICVREEFSLDSNHFGNKNYRGILKDSCVYIFR
jgi:hypothetical protein